MRLIRHYRPDRGAQLAALLQFLAVSKDEAGAIGSPMPTTDSNHAPVPARAARASSNSAQGQPTDEEVAG